MLRFLIVVLFLMSLGCCHCIQKTVATICMLFMYIILSTKHKFRDSVTFLRCYWCMTCARTSASSENGRLLLNVVGATQEECVRWERAYNGDIIIAEESLKRYIVLEKRLQAFTPSANSKRWIFQTGCIWEGCKVLLCLPQLMSTSSTPREEAMSVAKIINEICARDSLNKVVLHIDCKPIDHTSASNLSIDQLIVYVREINKLMVNSFPERLHACIVVGVPNFVIYCVWPVMKKFLHSNQTKRTHLMKSTEELIPMNTPYDYFSCLRVKYTHENSWNVSKLYKMQ